jgi:ABC-2 type transport system ATP-binding protein
MNPHGGIAIEASGLVKSFSRARALDGIDLVVPVGSVYGVLGPNGAGKTTMIRILATLVRPDEGSARVLGKDVVREAEAVRRGVSLTGQFSSVDQDLTGEENLVLVGRLLGLRPAEARVRSRELLDLFGLSDAARRRVGTYSGGMQRRLDIAASIVTAPDVLFLDEPTSGLDPRSRNEVWGIVGALVAGGATVLLTTQHLDEADRLADRIAVIDRGRVIADGTIAELKAAVGSTSLRVRIADPAQRAQAERVVASALRGQVQPESDPTLITAIAPDPQVAARGIAELSRSGFPVTDFALTRPSLDEVFLALTGHSSKADSRGERTHEDGTQKKEDAA